MNIKKLVNGDIVRHNYKNGHGKGVVVSVNGDGSEKFAYKVMFDSGEGPYPYSYNCEIQEIVPDDVIQGSRSGSAGMKG